MGEKTTPLGTGSFVESRLLAATRLKEPARRAKPRVLASGEEGKQTSPRRATTAAERRSPATGPKGTRKGQTPAQRAASLLNLAKARAARGV